jgi:hypothetical protein
MGVVRGFEYSHCSELVYHADHGNGYFDCSGIFHGSLLVRQILVT